MKAHGFGASRMRRSSRTTARSRPGSRARSQRSSIRRTRRSFRLMFGELHFRKPCGASFARSRWAKPEVIPTLRRPWANRRPCGRSELPMAPIPFLSLCLATESFARTDRLAAMAAAFPASASCSRPKVSFHRRQNYPSANNRLSLPSSSAQRAGIGGAMSDIVEAKPPLWRRIWNFPLVAMIVGLLLWSLAIGVAGTIALFVPASIRGFSAEMRTYLLAVLFLIPIYVWVIAKLGDPKRNDLRDPEWVRHLLLGL